MAGVVVGTEGGLLRMTAPHNMPMTISATARMERATRARDLPNPLGGTVKATGNHETNDAN